MIKYEKKALLLSSWNDLQFFFVFLYALLRLVFTSVVVVIRRVERHDLVKIKSTESEAEH